MSLGVRLLTHDKEYTGTEYVGGSGYHSCLGNHTGVGTVGGVNFQVSYMKPKAALTSKNGLKTR